MKPARGHHESKKPRRGGNLRRIAMRLKLKYIKRKFLEERILVLVAAKGELAREAKLLKLQTQEPRAKSVVE